MGSIIAMVAVVSVVAGIATITTKKLHSVFSSSTPKGAALNTMLQEWKASFSESRKNLIRVKEPELDIVAQEIDFDSKWLKAKNRFVGRFQTIYKEPIAQFAHQVYPKAKPAESLTLIQTIDNEYVYRTKGDTTFLSINGTPAGQFSGQRLVPDGSQQAIAEVLEQADGRTVHIDRGNRTLGILQTVAPKSQVVPRAFEFVDLTHGDDRIYFEALAFDFLLSLNLIE